MLPNIHSYMQMLYSYMQISIIQKVTEVQKWLEHELSGIDREITESMEL